MLSIAMYHQNVNPDRFNIDEKNPNLKFEDGSLYTKDGTELVRALDPDTKAIDLRPRPEVFHEGDTAW